MSQKPGPPKLPLVLLGLMTLATFVGPLVIVSVLGGGRSSGWPPDRPVEWWTFGLIVGFVVLLMTACLSVGAVLKRAGGRGERT